MRELKFDSREEFEKLFSEGEEKRDITDHIFSGIQEAIKYQKDSAMIFSICFQDDDDHTFEVTLPKSQFKSALNKCMENYQKWNLDDEQIDVYLLLKEVKKWEDSDK